MLLFDNRRKCFTREFVRSVGELLRKYYVCTNYGTACRRLTTKEKNERIKYVLQYSRTVLCATIRIAFNSSIESKWNPAYSTLQMEFGIVR